MIDTFIHLLVLLVFANRYLFPRLLAPMQDIDPCMDLEPSVTIIIPMFNEGEGIYRTVQSLLRQRYASSKLNIVVVDDCSKDDSLQWAHRACTLDPKRVQVLHNEVNMGKRRSINRAVVVSDSEIIVSVDSDVIAADDAIFQLVRRFIKPEIVAVGGRVNVLNRDENWLTRMQAVKYFFGYEYLKQLERIHRKVMCLSGCLTAYRREALLEIHDILEKRSILGIPIKYGEDRFLTRQLVKRGYETTLTLEAKCWTRAPADLWGYFSQQLRWRRSNIVDYMGGITHAWRLPPLIGIHYMSLGFLLLAYPSIIVLHMINGSFLDLAGMHILTLSVFCIGYWLAMSTWPAEERVHPLAFLAMAIVMPVTYVLLTPLALFTLDTGSWETRGHHAQHNKDSPSSSQAKPKPHRSLAPTALIGE